MKIHLLSDLHNEFEPFTPQCRGADVTILAGDIDVKAKGVAWARENFTGRVLYVPGNHEFYLGHLTNTLSEMKEQACARVQVLDREAVVIGDVRFLCATGWTEFDANGNAPLAMWDAQASMNDYRLIRCDSSYRKLSPSRTRDEAVRTRQWLRAQLETPFDGKTVIVTHHAPSVESTPGHRTSPLNPAYVNRWEPLCGDDVALWLHGHTHEAVDYYLGPTRVVSNPKGYPSECVEGFDPQHLITL